MTSCSDVQLAPSDFLEVNNRSSESLLTHSEIQWIESFRLNLRDNTLDHSYSVDNVIYGMKAIFNLVPGHGSKKINNLLIYKELNSYTVQDNMMTRDEISKLYEDIFNKTKSYYNDLTIQNKAFLFIDISLKNQFSQNVQFEVSHYFGDAELVDSPNFYSPDFCGDFETTDCFLSAFTYPGYIFGGGDCDGNGAEGTSAQRQIEEAINAKVPSILSNKFGFQGYVVYESIICHFYDFNDLAEFNLEINACAGDFADGQDELEYDGDLLNCVQCLLERFIMENTPPGFTLASISITSDFTPNSSSTLYWFFEICYGEPVFVPVHQPGPFPGNQDIILNTSIANKF
ncbi:MAG: hypothetical protein KJN66_04760 [Bacteroidia bacterium]|nr:hypothetical protein [Bacteroidia bacterium]